jgi:hypothetical protein
VPVASTPKPPCTEHNSFRSSRMRSNLPSDTEKHIVCITDAGDKAAYSTNELATNPHQHCLRVSRATVHSGIEAFNAVAGDAPRVAVLESASRRATKFKRSAKSSFR